MSYPIDLSVTGKPSPRTEQRPTSCRKESQMKINKIRNQRSSVFDGGTYEKKDCPSLNKNGKVHAGVISHSKLNEIIDLTNRDNTKPVTGQAVYPSARKVAPKGVPQLALDTVVGEEDDQKYNKGTPREIKVHSPGLKKHQNLDAPSKDHNHNNDKNRNRINSAKGGGWQVSQNSRRNSKPQSSNRKRDDVPDLDLNLSKTSDDLKELAKTAKQVKEDIKVEYMGNFQRNKNIYQSRQQPENKRNKKMDFVEETLLFDQMKMSEEEKPPITPQMFGVNRKFDSRVQRHKDLHSKNAGPHCLDHDLSRRLHFGARLLTSNNHDARRDINGFFFVDDGSITIYEYRQFGTKSTALPLIHRGTFTHAFGPHQGKAFCLLDIEKGKNLSFFTEHLHQIPESLQMKKVITFRITNVNETEKQKLLYSSCKSTKDRIDTENFIKSHLREQEVYAKKIGRAVHIKNDIREKCKGHGAKLLTNLHYQFNKMDSIGDGVLKKDEIEKLIQKYHVKLSKQNFDLLWETMDYRQDGKMDYGDFMRVCFGEMNEERKYWVCKAFARLDPKNKGVGSINDMKKFYNVSKDMKVTKGILTEREALNEFIEFFQQEKNKDYVTFSEFENYYEGLCLGYDDDDSPQEDDGFIKRIRSSWTI